MPDPIQLDPVELTESPAARRRRREEEELRARALDRLAMPLAPVPPTQEDVEAQAVGDAYRAMPDDEADTVQGRSRDEGPGGRVYAAGDIPPPEAQRQRMMDRDATRDMQRGSAAMAGQLAGLEAPAERQRPAWMRDVQNPRAQIEPTTAEEPGYQPSRSPTPASAGAPPTSTPAGGGKVAPPTASSSAGRDYTGLDVGDAIQAAALMFGNILTAARGDPSSGVQFHSQGQAARERDRVEALAQQERSATRRERGEALSAQQQQREQALALQREGMDRTDARAQAALDAQASRDLDDPNRQRIMQALQDQRDARDPASALSQDARVVARQNIAILPPQMRSLYAVNDLDRMSAEQIARLHIPTPGVRGSGGAGGGGGALRAPADQSGLSAAARAVGVSPAIIESEMRTARGRERLMEAVRREEMQRGRPRRGADESAGEELLPGIRSQIRLTAPEARAFRENFGSARRGYSAIGRVDELATQFGARAVISPEIRQRLGPIRRELEGMVSHLGNMGVINENEVPRIQAALPDPTSAEQQTLGTYRDALDEWRRSLERQISAGADAAGLDEENAGRLIQGLRRGSGSRLQSQDPAAPAPVAPPRAGMVRMRLPNGQVRDFPEANVAEAERRGAVRQ